MRRDFIIYQSKSPNTLTQIKQKSLMADRKFD
jgi:hypothetical protein